MNKTAIKNFAVWARKWLIDAVRQRAYEYEITDGGENSVALEAIGGKPLTREEKEQRRQLIGEINQKGYEQVMEEAAYTWFNRFVALRFMEVNKYLPSKVRVFTDEHGELNPEIMKEAMNVELEGLDRKKVLELLEKQDNDALYKLLLIAQCNALNACMPYMFEKIANWTELLFPVKLLRAGSVIDRMISDIPEEDWKDAVQIIGWLYQYYNSEKKDEVFAALKKNVKITKENIPAATQLFTPDWIVRYMVQNSLGRLWLEGHPQTKEQFLPSEDEQAAYAAGNRETEDNKWHYYLEDAEQEPEVQAQLNEIRREYAAMTPEQIKVIDPCCGSGHILVYMFDVLMQIYESCGYTTREAVASIVENNLYGLDIDDRAAQMAYFAVMMKARQYDRRFLTRKDEDDNPDVPQPHVYAIVASGHTDKKGNKRNAYDEFALAYFCDGDAKRKAAMDTIIRELYEAKEYGSILTVSPQDWSALYHRFEEIRQDISMYRGSALDDLLPLVQVAEALAQKYDVVVTNPPYMGSSGMNGQLSEYVKKHYPDSKSDLFACFIERCGAMTAKNRYQAMITQHAWMFLSSFEKLRDKLQLVETVNMAHLGARAFEEIGGEIVQTTSFVLCNQHISSFKGIYCRLIDPTTQQGKENMFLIGENRFDAVQDNFSKIPGSPVAYWASVKLFYDYKIGQPLGDIVPVKKGMTTADNDLFLRYWYEVKMTTLNRKWFKTHKGGEFRKWYGNDENVVNWENNGSALKSYGKAVIRNEDYYFKRCITWNDISSFRTGFRYVSGNSISNASGPSIYSDGDDLFYILGLCNSKVAEYIFTITCPTIHFEVGRIAEIPVLMDANFHNYIAKTVEDAITKSESDWDSFETSWDFKKNPLV